MQDLRQTVWSRDIRNADRSYQAAIRRDMNLKLRLKKLEVNLPDPNGCKCLDSTVYIATEYANKCYKCERPVDLFSWKSWDMILPTAENNVYAFGMQRNDAKAEAR